jgi:hypothetical protein
MMGGGRSVRRWGAILCALALSAAPAFALTGSVSHQVTLTVQEVASVDLNTESLVTLLTIPPAASGDPPTGQQDASKKLYYTAVNASGVTRIITVQWGALDAAPSGTSLRLSAASVPGGCGFAAAEFTLSNVAANLITAIPSCATGTGTGGAALQYTFAIDSPGSLIVGESRTVTITFTLGED